MICIMGSSFRTIAIGFLYLVSLLTIGVVVVFISTSPSATTRAMVKLRQLQNVRSFYNFRREEEYDKEQWKDWKKDIYWNDLLFLEAFETLDSNKLLQKRTTESSKVALCVLSPLLNFDMRDAARKTWANPSLVPMQNITLLFIIGQSNSSEENRKVLKEKEEFGDIIIGNFTDSKGNDTLKLLFSIYYVLTSLPSVEEIYFGFDSTYVHIQHLLKKFMFLEKKGIGQWRGFVMEGKKPERDKANPFYVSEVLFNESVYPTFCTLHNGFTLSSSLGKQILFMARNESLFVFPDIFIGMLAQKAKIKVIRDVSFGSQIHRPNLKLCEVRSSMTTFTFIGDTVKSWKTLTNLTEMRKCFVPDVDVVFPKMTDNRPYFKEVLQYLNNNESICSAPDNSHDERTFIVALISSFVGNFEQRLAVRETWASKHLFYGRTVRHVFVLGKATQHKNETQAKVDAEFRKYGDIIQGNFDESFQNLTLKVVLGLKWITDFCPDAAYLYKGDEDMFVAWPRVLMFLLQTSDRIGSPVMKQFFVGSSMTGSPRIDHPKSRYYVNGSIYHGRFYPRYCSGGSYILSTDIIPELYKRSLVTPLIPIDDAYQGILTEQIGVHPIHHKGFKVFFNKKECILQKADTLTLHGFKEGSDLRKVWNRYIEKKECLNDP